LHFLFSVLQVFANALNNISHGKLTPAEIAMFKSRENIEGPADAIHLISRNAVIRIRNSTYLDSLTIQGAEEAFKTAVDECQSKDKTAKEVNQFKEYAKTADNNETRGMAYKLRLVIGSKYMVTTNINVSGNRTK